MLILPVVLSAEAVAVDGSFTCPHVDWTWGGRCDGRGHPWGLHNSGGASYLEILERRFRSQARERLTCARVVEGWNKDFEGWKRGGSGDRGRKLGGLWGEEVEIQVGSGSPTRNFLAPQPHPISTPDAHFGGLLRMIWLDSFQFNGTTDCW